MSEKLVLRDLLSLVNLMKAQTLWFYFLTNVIIVNKNKKIVFTAF